MALAHKLDELVRSGGVTDHGELARLGHVSPARICQYMTLLHLSPAIQEYLLFLAVSQASRISKEGLRRIAREPRWIASVPFLILCWCGSDAFSTLGPRRSSTPRVQVTPARPLFLAPFVSETARPLALFRWFQSRSPGTS